MGDGEIVELFLRRDESAIQHASEKYGRRLRSLSLGIVGDRQTAEECENDTYVKAWNAIPPNEPKDHLYAFLARIVRNISLNCCRSRRRLKRKAFICELSAEKRNIFLRRYWYLESIADIAKRFGLSESKVKTTLFRSRIKLREHLEKEGFII